MGPFRSLLTTEAKMRAFRAWFNIPEDVAIALYFADFTPAPEDNVLLIPLLWVFEAGIRFPLPSLLRQVLAFLDITPAQCANNLIRVVMGVLALNEITGSNLIMDDIFRYFILTENNGIYNFRPMLTYTPLLDDLPASDAGADDDMIAVVGNWEFAAGEDTSFRVPRAPGSPGKFVPFALLHSIFLINYLVLPLIPCPP